MAAGKEEKKDEKGGKDKMEGKEEKKKDGIEVIDAIYKLSLHCPECGNKIKKHLMITEGVQTVNIDIEKGEIKAKGKLDPLKILKVIEKKSKKKVELISPKVKPKEITAATTTDKKAKEIKDPIIRTISVKVHMHCDKCEADLKRRLIKHKGIFNVKTDKKAESVTVEGTIEVEKLISFLRKRVHKNAEIISVKEEKKEEKKEKGKEERKSSEATKDKGEKKEKEKGKEEGKSSEATKDKEEKKEKEKDKEEGKSSEATKDRGDGSKSSSGESTKKIDGDNKSGETTKVIEIHHDGHTQDEIKIKDNVPYIIHYVYAPQLFSDENPNSCTIS